MDEHEVAAPPRKPGTRPKGRRKAITARVPDEHAAVYERKRTEAGYANLNDYITALLATVHELPVPEYAHPRRTDQHRHRQEDLWRATG